LKKKPKIAIIDTGTSNLRSVKYALEEFNANVYQVSSTEDFSKNTDAIITPGIGSFPVVMEKIKENGLDKIILDQISNNMPCMFICVGMQILFSKSYELGVTDGLNIFNGEVKKIITKPKKNVPVIGWNKINNKNNCPILKNNFDNRFYFTHSFFVNINKNEKDIISSTANYGNLDYCASISYKNIFAFQFHPEKSGRGGLEIYKNFLNLL
tara:strand:+ start:18639 stop:19271 length:633 start_codon:yes stop_codon:yes gene_type:complete